MCLCILHHPRLTPHISIPNPQTPKRILFSPLLPGMLAPLARRAPRVAAALRSAPPISRAPRFTRHLVRTQSTMSDQTIIFTKDAPAGEYSPVFDLCSSDTNNALSSWPLRMSPWRNHPFTRHSPWGHAILTTLTVPSHQDPYRHLLLWPDPPHPRG